MIVLAVIFGSTFMIARVTGVLTVENVKLWLEMVQASRPGWVAGVVITLLFIDIIVSVPTLTITILAGFFLGFPLGFAASITGMSLAAFLGYGLSWRWGKLVIRAIIKDEEEHTTLQETFLRSGPPMIVLSRAAPMLPEITACLAGATRMPFQRYLLFYLLSTLPYAAIASYAGSVSTIDSPQPAIFAALFLYSVLWCSWFVFRKFRHKVS